jgi:CheY-like chemotaxis protein
MTSARRARIAGSGRPRARLAELFGFMLAVIKFQAVGGFLLAAMRRRALSAMAVRCLIVEDNQSFLDAARKLLEQQGLTVVGVASTSEEALRRARRRAGESRSLEQVVIDSYGMRELLALIERWGPAVHRGWSSSLYSMSSNTRTPATTTSCRSSRSFSGATAAGEGRDDQRARSPLRGHRCRVAPVCRGEPDRDAQRRPLWPLVGDSPRRPEDRRPEDESEANPEPRFGKRLALAPSCARLEEADLPQEGAADGQLDRDDRLEELNRYVPDCSLSLGQVVGKDTYGRSSPGG